MGISDAVQTLTAAFSFGILLQAALGVLFIFIRSNEGTSFADGRRLVLILFVLFAALWAQIDFLNLIINSTSSSLCQVSLIFSTMTDQLARVSIEQFLLWSVGHGTKVTLERMVMQGVLLLRLGAGGALGGFTRPDFAPVCVAKTTVMSVSIAVLSLDVLIIGVLLMRAVALGIFREMRQDKSMARREQSKGLIMTIVGLAAWTATSVPMILGIPSILLLLRTLLPAGGLFILILVVLIFSGSLILPVDSVEITTPEARSPFVAPTASTREIMRRNVGNGSPMPNPTFTKNGSLFVTNPSTPRDSPRSFQGNQLSTPQGFTKRAGETRDMGFPEPNRQKVRSGPQVGRSGESTLGAPNGASFNPSMAASTPRVFPDSVDSPEGQISEFSPHARKQKGKKFLFGRGKSPEKPVTIQGFVISHPHMTSGAALSNHPIPKMRTVDLDVALQNERERREGAAARAQLVASRPPPPPSSLSLQQAGARMSSVRRKEISKPVQDVVVTVPSSSVSGLSTKAVNGSTTSASLSPGREDLRRRSPRGIPVVENDSASKPSLTRNLTIGLPSNPRARANLFPFASVAQQQTVMLIDDVAYDNPGLVKTIIQEVPRQHAAGKSENNGPTSPISYTTELKTSGSIIHRPRPVKRESDHDRGHFPAEPSPGHKRSKSQSSAASRKSLFNMPQGSPTALPPLPPPPPPPVTATRVGRILPNDTKSMTFHEKVELLFPHPPGTSITNRRRSSVPSLPSRSLLDVTSPTEQEDKDRRESSERASTYVFGDVDINLSGLEPKQSMRKNEKRQSYWFSKNTRRSVADQVGETWIPGISSKQPNVSQQLKEKSLPPSPDASVRKSSVTMTTFTNDSDDSTSFWGSLHSKLPAVDISKAMLNARETIIQRRGQTPIGSAKPSVPPKIETNIEDPNTVSDSEEEIRSVLESHDRRQTFFIEDDAPTRQVSIQNIPSWHRRIGDELPTFSERKTKPKVRKMPPPAPLLLRRPGRQATVVVRNSEPSPLESPEHAMRELEEQLGRFDESNRGSVGSLLRRMPDAETESHGNPEGLALLENLEKEMGQQASVWQQMQTNMDRDSISVTMSPVRTEPDSSVSREPSQRSTKRPPRNVSRRARIRSSMTVRSKGEDSGSTPSTESSDNSRASAWQQRLAGAQIEYMENAPALLQNRNLNFLSMSKSRFQDITPPDSDHSIESGTDVETGSESESESAEAERLQSFKSKKPTLVWQSKVPTVQLVTRALWIQPSSLIRGSSLEPAAKDLRPAPRFARGILPISSIFLWTKPCAGPKNQSRSLWTSKKSHPKSLVTRPITQRPQRKSRRQTFLPDIVESPVPVPNKRETLGIFQFPWGELSDQPVYQPTFDLSMLAGSILSAKLNARSHELEPTMNDYESSFFDDYDEDQSEDEEGGDQSDDDFDETTLWEIASLLKSNDVPSRESMFPGKEIIEDYDESEASDSEVHEYSGREVAPLGTPSQRVPQLWTNSVVKVATNFGLVQPEPRVWSALVMSATPEICQKHRGHKEMPVLASRSLWTAASLTKATFPATSTWSKKLNTSSMWTSAPQLKEVAVSGLFNSAQRTEFRVTSLLPAAIKMERKLRTVEASLSQLTSNELWNGTEEQFTEHHWISESSIRPESPSIYSTSSSGRSSPDSDASSAISMSSKASSLWSAVGTTAWWEQHNAQKSTANDPKRPITPVKNAPHPSKVPLRKQGTPLPSVRESRVLASRDIWEQMAPTIDPKPVKKYGKLLASKENAQPVHKPLHQQHRPVVAYPDDWEEALAEAITAGTPRKKLGRRAATASDREVALMEAVSRSQPLLQRPAYSPQMWATALVEAVARSQTTKAIISVQKFDPAVMHPVFFTSTLITMAGDIHPAAIGYVVKPGGGVWKPTSSLPTSSGKAPMWRTSAAFDRNMSTEAELLKGRVRTAPTVKGVVLSKLQSKDMWQPTLSSSFEENWLISSTKRAPVSMWTAPDPALKEISNSYLWSVNADTTGLFTSPHKAPWKKTKRAETGLFVLETKGLWRPSLELPPSPTHWLKKREVRGVVFRY